MSTRDLKNCDVYSQMKADNAVKTNRMDRRQTDRQT